MASSKVSGTTLKWIAKVIPRDVVADSLEVNATNLSKLYQRKSLSRTQTEGLEDLTHLWKDVQQDLFSGDEKMMKRWMDTPVPALDGETPKKLMGTLTGRKVLDGCIRDSCPAPVSGDAGRIAGWLEQSSLSLCSSATG